MLEPISPSPGSLYPFSYIHRCQFKYLTFNWTEAAKEQLWRRRLSWFNLDEKEMTTDWNFFSKDKTSVFLSFFLSSEFESQRFFKKPEIRDSTRRRGLVKVNEFLWDKSERDLGSFKMSNLSKKVKPEVLVHEHQDGREFTARWIKNDKFLSKS